MITKLTSLKDKLYGKAEEAKKVAKTPKKVEKESNKPNKKK
jgi:hypothetical protein